MSKLYSGLRYRASMKLRYWFSKWPLAGLLNRSVRTCWADLVSWAMYKPTGNVDEDEFHQLSNLTTGGDQCRRDSLTEGCCYCGKFSWGEPTGKGETPGAMVDGAIANHPAGKQRETGGDR